MKRKNNQHTTTTTTRKKIAKKLEKGILALGFLHPFSVSIVFCFAMSKLENEALYALYYWTKGQLILKCPFGCLQIYQKSNEIFPGFLSLPIKRGQIKNIRTLYTSNLVFRRFEDTKRTF